jgi:hypothetical protein
MISTPELKIKIFKLKNHPPWRKFKINTDFKIQPLSLSPFILYRTHINLILPIPYITSTIIGFKSWYGYICHWLCIKDKKRKPLQLQGSSVTVIRDICLAVHSI